MEPTLTVFDMAGTTVHDGDAVHHHLAMALASHSVTADRDEINAVMGIPKPIAIRTILESRLPFGGLADREEVEAIHRDFLTTMLSYYRSSPEVRAVEGAEETFAILRSAGIKIALDTGFSRPIADAIVERLGWLREGLVDAVVTSDDVSRGRPHPEMIYRAMRLTGTIDPEAVAKIGDTPSDLKEGHAAGCGWIVGVTGGSHTAEQLAAYPHTHLIHTVAELPALFARSTKRGHELSAVGISTGYTGPAGMGAAIGGAHDDVR